MDGEEEAGCHSHGNNMLGASGEVEARDEGVIPSPSFKI